MLSTLWKTRSSICIRTRDGYWREPTDEIVIGVDLVDLVVVKKCPVMNSLSSPWGSPALVLPVSRNRRALEKTTDGCRQDTCRSRDGPAWPCPAFQVSQSHRAVRAACFSAAGALSGRSGRNFTRHMADSFVVRLGAKASVVVHVVPGWGNSGTARANRWSARLLEAEFGSRGFLLSSVDGEFAQGTHVG